MKKLFTFFIALSMAAGLAAQVYFSEDFESGIPAGWIAENEWKHGTAAALSSDYFNITDHTLLMAANDDILLSGGDASGRLITSKITLASGVAPFLTFQGYFYNGDYEGDETAQLQISLDSVTWTTLVDLGGAGDWQSAACNMTPYIGQSFWLAFAYSDGGSWNYGFAVDDIVIQEIPAKDLTLLALNTDCFYSPVGTETPVFGFFQNHGAETVNSFDVNWTDGTNNYTETVTGLNVEAYSSGRFDLSNMLVLPNGTVTVDATISNINGTGDDDDTSDNSASFEAEGISISSFKADRGVLIEEATGTWCGWCPRGTVFMNLLSCFGENFIGIAVHNSDPMENAAYDGALQDFPDFPGYPSVLFQRTEILDPQDMVDPFITAAEEDPQAIIRIGATWEESTRVLGVTVYIQPQTELTGDYKLNAILFEDGISGATSSYDQQNYYSGGGNGPMNGYESMPAAVPASQMVYDHVGRRLMAGFNGAAGSLPATMEAGEWYEYTFNTYIVPGAWNVDNMHIAAVVLDPDNQSLNAWKSTVADAVIFTGVEDATVLNEQVEVYPNPFSGQTNIRFFLQEPMDVNLRVLNAVGQVVSVQTLGELSGDVILPFDGTGLETGMYLLEIEVGGQLVTKKVSVLK